jgi:hypothetical protein
MKQSNIRDQRVGSLKGKQSLQTFIKERGREAR